MTFKVCEAQCNECLFSSNKIVSNLRKKQIIQKCLAENSFFVCHKYGVEDSEGNATGEQVCCRGFYDTYGPQINLIRIAERLDAVEFIEEKKDEH